MAESSDNRSLLTLLGQIPQVVGDLVAAELNRLKAEIAFKAKNFGLGGAFVLAAAFIAVFLLGTLIATGILALALVMPAWAAALSVSGVLLLIIVIFALLALRAFKRGSEPVETAESLKQDLNAIKGVGEYDR
ncbi:phage holin family protein [Agromyces atrinae]|uniref:O-antigen ligase n=1 Tax=Agromyces atrinae TaxID=592376 RepID=A0A852SHL0_9MICO|nr:phage holin family protein [Agromyces atrinae]MCI2956953.1 phage holin family protein [Agromyces atrinae]NYD67715.1 O-antigen ligase [Agromyces atrinae]